jgi:hypothetical protein
MFWKRKGSQKFNQAACQAGAARKRMERPLEPRPVDHAGEHAMQIIVRHKILGVEHTFDLHVSDVRRNSYWVTVDGFMCMPKRMGWTEAVELAGKSFVRVQQV